MKSLLNKLVSSSITRRVAVVAAPLAVLGAAVSTASAAGGPWWHHDRRRPEIVIHAEIPGPRVVVERRVVVVDEMPAGLQVQAYQSQDRVIVLINGTNRGAGFRTAVMAEGGDRAPRLILHNTAPVEGCREVATGFSISTSLRASRELSSICVQVGDRTIDVPVTCVSCLS